MTSRTFFLAFALGLAGAAGTVWPQDAATANDSTAAANDSSPPRITAIIIEGNRRTKPYVILREMQSKVGALADAEVLARDRKRILNLGIFSRVDIQGYRVASGVEIMITVFESWFLYPYPIVFLNDREWNWDKLSYGAGLLHLNFRGRNETISASGWAGYNPSVQLDYGNPWMFGKANLFGRWRFFSSRTQNRFYQQNQQEVSENRIGGSFTLGRRFGYFNYLSVNAGYSELELDPYVPGQTLNPSGKDELPTLGVTYAYDARDFFEYPLEGTYGRLWARRVGFGQQNINYTRYGLDVRRYQKISKHLTLAAYGMADLGRGKIPIYDLVYLGYGNRVRGRFFDRVAGRHVALGSVEARLPLIPLRYLSMAKSSVLRQMVPGFMQPFVSNVKFGMNLALFYDYGVAWSKSETPDWKTGLSGFGAGLHFHLPLLGLLRVELASDDKGKLQGIFDMGVAF